MPKKKTPVKTGYGIDEFRKASLSLGKYEWTDEEIDRNIFVLRTLCAFFELGSMYGRLLYVHFYQELERFQRLKSSRERDD